MVNAQKSGLIKRCLLAGAMALGNAGLSGCDTLDARQTASLHGLMSWSERGYWENERNEAIRETGRGSGNREYPNDNYSNDNNNGGCERIMTTELWNLDTGKKEMEVYDWDYQIDYVQNVRNFPKKGFLVFNQINNKNVSQGYIVTLENGKFEVTIP